MGYIKVKASFYNAIDYVGWLKGELSEANVRRVDIEALVDTSSTYPALPEDLVEKLGLTLLREVDGETAGGVSKLKLYGLVIVEIEDRIAECPVIQRP
ncbi:MAG: retroviral-like aspartic protease family protein, partial [Desulfurococcaceae archaeon]|nr:retroviral-like aspartic protease family protein [Desulfurococcaceae archaeon]